jgi:hypothetical protein
MQMKKAFIKQKPRIRPRIDCIRGSFSSRAQHLTIHALQTSIPQWQDQTIMPHFSPEETRHGIIPSREDSMGAQNPSL